MNVTKWYRLFPKSTGLAPFVWLVLFILPFYFVFQTSSSSPYKITAGIVLIILFFISYRLSFASTHWRLYVWTSVQIVISIAMTYLFGYVYFSFFLAFFIGNIQNKAGFFSMYTIHLVTTFITVNIGFVTQNKWFLTQFPFILLSILGIIIIPFNNYARNRRGELEDQLEDANKRISDLVKQEERQRIARDLHDTLGQKLSLIGLKSDLARKLVHKNPERAREEMKDVNYTARAALKEVREMVSEMRGTKLEEEIIHVRNLLRTSEIELIVEGNSKLDNVSFFVENVLSMCMKEAVTNVVRHSGATTCHILIEQSVNEITVQVHDNGCGCAPHDERARGNGLLGMKERLEFVEGSLELLSDQGTRVVIKVPHVVKQSEEENR